ncbi:hypothetical protein ACVIYL_004833 [Bradyrhizobium sp. USDA 3315]
MTRANITTIKINAESISETVAIFAGIECGYMSP